METGKQVTVEVDEVQLVVDESVPEGFRLILGIRLAGEGVDWRFLGASIENIPSITTISYP